jgi:hypothetical protein
MEKTGIFIIGVLKGYSESEWSNPQSGKSGINRRLGVITSDFTDQWGEVKENVETIEVPQDMAFSVRQQAEKLKGRPVQVSIAIYAHTGGKNGAWAKYVMRRNSEIIGLGAAAATSAPRAVAEK